jgi:uncharacterized iron-regulated protein
MAPTSTVADPDLAEAFRDAEIVILGEIHDNVAHHANQTSIVQKLQPDALVFEMIEPRKALAITPDIRGNPAKLENVLAWKESGWPDFAMYFPIFEAAPDAAVFGGAAQRAKVRRAVSEGASVVFGDAAVLFGLDRPLEESYLQRRLDLQREAHCGALPDEMLPGMVEAQRLRDAEIAKATVAALENAMAADDTPQVVVIAGNGHAREDWGVPAMLRTYYASHPEIKIRTLGQYEITEPVAAPYTTWIATEPAKRDDPCDAFRK